MAPGAASEAPKSGLVDREACDECARPRCRGPGGEDFGEHGVGVVDFRGRGAGRTAGIGTPGSGRGGKGRGEGKGFSVGGGGGWVYY